MLLRASLRRAVPAAVLAALAVSAPAAADGSLTYIKDGNVQLAAPDGSNAKQLTTDGGFQFPSQADDGTIVAARQAPENGRNPRRLHRINREGQLLNPPTATVPVDNSYYVGPLAPRVSPDGRHVAYHYFYTGPLTDDETVPKVAYAHSDRDTPPNTDMGAMGGYFNPSWLPDGRALLGSASPGGTQMWIDAVGTHDAIEWFRDDAATPILADPEVTRQGDRLIATDGDELRFYALTNGVGGSLEFVCAMPNAGVKSAVWSPDGRAIAFESPAGIEVMQVPDLAACGSAQRTLVAPGGAQPHWGPAAPPAPPKGPEPDPDKNGGPGGGPKPPTAARITLRKTPKTLKLVALRRGVKLKVRCPQACALTAKLKAGKATVATGKGKAAAGRTATIKLKVTKAGRKRLARAKRTKATLTVVSSGEAGRATVRRKLTVRR